MTKVQMLISVAAVLIVLTWAAFFGNILFSRSPGAIPGGSNTYARFLCRGNATIDTDFLGNSARIHLSDGRTVLLSHAVSADGARYANADESFVFWNKGNTAFITEAGTTTLRDCIVVAPAPSGWTAYENPDQGFSMSAPAGYRENASYKYEAFGPGSSIPGTSFTIPETYALGTNLSTDSYISVEEIPEVDDCSANRFLLSAPPATTVTDGDTTYSYASTTDAGAGNRYEETVYAIPGTSPCIAVRYFIHYGAIENYPAGAVKEFDKKALISEFDQIRRTLMIGR